MKYKILIGVGVVVLLVVAMAVIEFLMIKNGGSPVPVPNTPRGAESFGNPASPAISYVVMGDSTSVGQGGDYDQGIARATARYLGRDHSVTMHNVGISGARAADVVHKQLAQATAHKPDYVLIAICANDVTHLTSTASVQRSLETTIDGLRAANPAVKIVLTGSPQMGSVPRFPQPVRYAAKLRTAQINKMVSRLASSKHVSFAAIAANTGPTFSKHPELFAADRFHPTTAGYDVWIPFLEQAFGRT